MRENVFPELHGELRRHTDVGPRLAPVSPIRESLTDLLHRDRTREQPNIGDIGDVSAIPSFEGIVLKPVRADHRSDRDKARNRTPDIKDHTISGTSLCVNSPPVSTGNLLCRNPCGEHSKRTKMLFTAVYDVKLLSFGHGPLLAFEGFFLNP
jgi:hypothetical protein